MQIREALSHSTMCFWSPLLLDGHAVHRRCDHACHPESIAMNIPLLSVGHGYGRLKAGWRLPWRRPGGMGVIHRNLTTDQQADEVRRVEAVRIGIVY